MMICQLSVLGLTRKLKDNITKKLKETEDNIKSFIFDIARQPGTVTMAELHTQRTAWRDIARGATFISGDSFYGRVADLNLD